MGGLTSDRQYQVGIALSEDGPDTSEWPLGIEAWLMLELHLSQFDQLYRSRTFQATTKHVTPEGSSLKQGKDIPQTVARTARSATGICLLYKARCTFFRCLRCPVLHPRRCERRPASTFLHLESVFLLSSFVCTQGAYD